MNTNDLILAKLKKLIHDLSYYEVINQWDTNQSYQKQIHQLNIEIKTVCDVMNIIGSDNFWIHENGIIGFDNLYVDVKQRFGLFSKV